MNLISMTDQKSKALVYRRLVLFGRQFQNLEILFVAFLGAVCATLLSRPEVQPERSANAGRWTGAYA